MMYEIFLNIGINMNYYDLMYNIVIGKGNDIQYNILIAFNKWKLFYFFYNVQLFTVNFIIILLY